MMKLLTSGMVGEPIPYLLHTDWLITSILFLCMILTSLTLSKEKKYLLQQLKSSLANRSRSSMFDETITSGMHHKLLLAFHTCILLGLAPITNPSCTKSCRTDGFFAAMHSAFSSSCS